MDLDDLTRQLLQTFSEELSDKIHAMNAALLRLEKTLDGPERDEHLQTLLRSAHGLKGAARAVDLGSIELLCHELESFIVATQRSASLAGSELEVLFQAVDALSQSARALAQGREPSALELRTILDRLRRETKPGSVDGLAAAGEIRESRAPESGVASALPPRPTTVPPPASEEPGRNETSHVARVAIAKLDSLLDRCGELSSVRSRLESRQQDAAQLRAALTALRAVSASKRPLPRELVSSLEQGVERLCGLMKADEAALRQALTPLEEDVRRARMFPFAQACSGLERVVRDLAKSQNKAVALVVTGGHVEVDRAILEGLAEPLLHLVRNAVDHGIEPPGERQAHGKAAQATVRIAATLRGSGVEVVVSDDGRGLDLESLKSHVASTYGAAEATERELAELVFLSGVSTSKAVTAVSGRGVGLSAVRARVESLHGTVSVEFEPGQRTAFVLKLPLTRTLTRLVLVRSAGQMFGIMASNVVTLRRIRAGDTTRVDGRPSIIFDAGPVPLVSLAGLLGLESGAPPSEERITVALLSAGDARIAVSVEEAVAERESLVKGLGRRVLKVPNVLGATILETGELALVLNTAELVRSALRQPQLAQTWRVEAPRRRLLVVDDSPTVRAMERSILEAAGFDVELAVDGQQAWRLLQERGADAVITDVEMPNLDGFSLTELIKGSQRFREVPVVLLTSRENDEDRKRGMMLGAHAYLFKSALDVTELVETISQIL
jgi:two-component system chemotaxis sensor kinase CheA